VFQQFVGINVIFYYSTTLWRAVGFSENSALITSVITSVTNILTTLIAIALIDRIGRKPLLLIGAAGMIVTLATMAICFSTATGHGSNITLSTTVGHVALVAANLYVFAFGMSWGPVVWVLLGEIFSNRIRGPRSPWPPPPSGWPTGPSPRPSRRWPGSAWPWRTACTRSSPCSRSSSWRVGSVRPRAASWRPCSADRAHAFSGALSTAILRSNNAV